MKLKYFLYFPIFLFFLLPLSSLSCLFWGLNQGFLLVYIPSLSTKPNISSFPVRIFTTVDSLLAIFNYVLHFFIVIKCINVKCMALVLFSSDCGAVCLISSNWSSVPIAFWFPVSTFTPWLSPFHSTTLTTVKCLIEMGLSNVCPFIARGFHLVYLPGPSTLWKRLQSSFFSQQSHILWCIPHFLHS